MLVLALLLAAAAALATRYTIGSSGLRERVSIRAESSAQVLVDTRLSSLAVVALPSTAAELTQRTPLFADYAASLPVKNTIASLAGVSPSALSITADTTETGVPAGGVQSGSYNAAPAPPGSDQVTLSATDLLPILTISTTASSPGKAAQLVQATVTALKQSVHALESAEHVKGPNRIVLRPLGAATATSVRVPPSLAKGIGIGVVVLVLLVMLILAFDGARRASRSKQPPPAPAAAS